MMSVLTAIPGLPMLAEGGGFNPLELDPDFWALFFWTALVFLILLFLLGKYAWKPLMATVDAREKKIEGDIQNAEQARAEAEAARTKLQAEVEESAQKAKEALEEARERAEKLQAELKAQAHSEAEAMIAKARAQIDAEKRQALDQIKEQVVELSVEISKRIAAGSIDREDHLREADVLIQKLKEVA